MIFPQHTEIRCQFCGVSGNVGRMRLATEPPEAASRRMCDGTPIINDANCVGCFVVTDDGAEDKRDAADTSFVPEDIEEQEGADECMYNDVSEDDSSEGEQDEKEKTKENTGDCEVEMEMETEMDTNSYMQFLKGSPSDNCNIIVPFNNAYKKRDQTWPNREHISGPECCLHNAYSGHNITADELRGCNTMQLLCPKPSDWTPEPGDEPLEVDEACPSFLSGLRDHLHPSFTIKPVFSPMRHDQETFDVHNRPGKAKDRQLAAMPFHPACFEVFKRASLKRCDVVDVQGLMGWYQTASKQHFKDEDFPQGDAVRRAAKNEDWEHGMGDEWIAANPCFVPALHDAMQQLATDEVFMGPRADAVVDGIAEISLSSEAAVSNTTLSQASYFGHISHDMPWVWEAWCTQPYSGWSAVTQSDIAKDPLDVSYRREFLNNLIDATLKAKDGRELSAVKLAQLQDELQGLHAKLEAFEEENRFVPKAIPATQLPQHGTDWCKLYLALQKLRETSNGLRNRERVWHCCDYILDRIAEQRKNGKIVTNKSERHLEDGRCQNSCVKTGTHNVRGLDFAEDYSEGEAEFSDDYQESEDELSEPDDVEMDVP